MRRPALALSALLLLLPLAVEAKRGKSQPPPGPTVVPPTNVFIRTSFDDDPSAYIGRFVARGATNVDESSAAKTTCSQHISYRKVGGGGVMYDELFNASSQVAARLGIPPIAGASGSAGSQTSVRVTYTLTDKLIADVADPAAFDACCESYPDQCTGLYIGEFLGGTGAMWAVNANTSEADLDAIAKGIAADMQYAHGTVWKRSIQFPNPVYFAFKTTEVLGSDNQVAAGCGDWIQQAPTGSSGLYFVGQSDFLDREDLARDLALRNARTQVLQWAENEISGGSSGSYTVTSSGGNSSTASQETGSFEQKYSGVVSQLKDKNWCVKSEATPGGVRYKAYVLAFLPNAAVDALK